MATTLIRTTAPFDLGGLGPRRRPGRLSTHAGVAVAAFVAYILARQIQGPASTVLAAFGVSACGWSWLLTRALFDPAERDAVWSRLVVLVLVVSGAVSVLAPSGGAVTTLAGNLYMLSGSAALLLTLVEPFQRHGCVLTLAEVRFRAVFVGVFALLVGVAVLAAWKAPERVETLCAAVGLVGAVAAVIYRRRRPLTRVEQSLPASRTATADDRRLAERLERLLRDEAVHLEPDLRIGDVAARLGQPEHRVSRCISTATGFANFNRLINHHRVEAAKIVLAAPEAPRSILHVALDCGFASLGPFNRAFREETGMTPRAYRAAHRSGATPT